MIIKKKDPIFLAGHNGLIGSAIYKKLILNGYKKIITVNKKNLDLRDQHKVFNFFKKNRFKFIIIAAAKVGGIYANMNYKADFIYDNLSIQSNIIHCCYKYRVKNFYF
jgi:GDP-L-fucose synthase